MNHYSASRRAAGRVPSAVLVAGLALASSLSAQSFSVFSSGLMNPSKLVTGPNGSLLVTEAGTAPNSGRVSLVDSSGVRRTLIDGLPSGLAAPNLEPDGPDGLVLNGRTLFVLIGEGDGFRNGTAQGTLQPNPAGSSSPIFASLLQVMFSNDPDKLGSAFTLRTQDHSTLLDGTSVTLTNSGSETAQVRMVAQFRPGVPDPVTIYRNSHPYGITMLPSQPNTLYVADAGLNLIKKVDSTTGQAQTLARIASIRNPTPVGGPFIEAVPTNVRAYGDQLLVSYLTGFPFVQGLSGVAAVDTATGNATPFIASRSSAIDVMLRTKADGTPQFLVLEYSVAMTATPPGPGRVVVYDTPEAKILAEGLQAPTSMAFDPSSGNLYVTEMTKGDIVSIRLQN